MMLPATRPVSGEGIDRELPQPVTASKAFPRSVLQDAIRGKSVDDALSIAGIQGQDVSFEKFVDLEPIDNAEGGFRHDDESLVLTENRFRTNR